MKKLKQTAFLLLVALALSGASMAQNAYLINRGANIHLNQTAVTVLADVTNSVGTITTGEKSKFIIEGNLDNSGIFTSGTESELNIKNAATNKENGTITFGEKSQTTIGDLENYGKWILKNGASHIDNGISEAGTNSTVELALAANDIHYVSQPVEQATSDVFTGTFVKRYNEKENLWQGLTANTNLTRMAAYSVQPVDQTLVKFAGALNSNEQNLNLSTEGSGWHLIGNPFPSAIDWDKIGDKRNIDNTLYFWNGTNYQYYLGNSPQGNELSGLNLGDENKATNIIPAMQGFFIKVADLTADAHISVDYQARLHATETPFYKKSSKLFTHIRLAATGNGYTDKTIVAFPDGASNEFDSSFDAYKLISTYPGMPQLYTSTPKGTDLAINSMGGFDKSMRIPLNFTASTTGTYTIALDEVELIDEVYIYDAQTGKTHNMSNKNELSFRYETGDNLNRFTILFSEQTATAIEAEARPENQFSVFAKDKTIIINSRQAVKTGFSAMVFDVLGRTMHKCEISGQKTEINTNYRPGTYFVKITNGKQTITKQIIL